MRMSSGSAPLALGASSGALLAEPCWGGAPPSSCRRTSWAYNPPAGSVAFSHRALEVHSQHPEILPVVVHIPEQLAQGVPVGHNAGSGCLTSGQQFCVWGTLCNDAVADHGHLVR